MVDQLLSKFKNHGILQLLSPLIQQLIERGLADARDGRFLSIALLILSQMAEYVTSCEDFMPLMPIILSVCSHPSSTVRFCVFHCLGQLCIDQGPGFQKLFGENVLPTLVSGVSDEVNI